MKSNVIDLNAQWEKRKSRMLFWNDDVATRTTETTTEALGSLNVFCAVLDMIDVQAAADV